MMLKKSIALLLAIVMSVVLCGCGETNDTNGSSSVEDETSSVVTQSPSSETPSSNEEKPVSSEPQPVGYDFSKPVPEIHIRYSKSFSFQSHNSGLELSSHSFLQIT